jgi:F0F1-type ATP synthase assembly protein I
VVVADGNKQFSKQVGQYLSMALLLPVSTFVGYAIGYLLDRLFHTKFLTIVFLILGSAAGFVQLYRELSRDSNDGGT